MKTINRGDIVEIARSEEPIYNGVRYEVGKIINNQAYGRVRNAANSDLELNQSVSIPLKDLDVIETAAERKGYQHEIKRGDKIQVTVQNYDSEVIVVGVAYRKTQGDWYTVGGAKLTCNFNTTQDVLLLERVELPGAADYAVGTVLKSGGRYILTKVADNLWSSFSMGSGSIVTRTDDDVDAFEEVEVLKEQK